MRPNRDILRRLTAEALLSLTIVGASPARAGRPMITDDAGVVGEHALQVETWLRLDDVTLEHWLVVGYGPIDVLELSAGAVHGTLLEDSAYALRGPIVQLKLLAFEPKPGRAPGLAFATGAFAPWGFGGFEQDGFGVYGYAAGTLSPLVDDRLLFHVNLGVARRLDAEGITSALWGAGGMASIAGPVLLFGELVSGDSDTQEPDGALHGGIKCEVGDNAHVDVTVGGGLWGADPMPLFGTLGVRWSTD